MQKKLKIFLIVLVVLSVCYVVRVKINTWYPDFKREVNAFDNRNLEIVYVDESREGISNMTYLELLEGRALFSKAIGYVQEYTYEKNGVSYLVSIWIECDDNDSTAIYEETYQGFDIDMTSYGSEFGETYSTTAHTQLGKYRYTVESIIDKEDCEDNNEGMKMTKEVTLDMMHELIDDYIQK